MCCTMVLEKKQHFVPMYNSYRKEGPSMPIWLDLESSKSEQNSQIALNVNWIPFSNKWHQIQQKKILCEDEWKTVICTVKRLLFYYWNIWTYIPNLIINIIWGLMHTRVYWFLNAALKYDCGRTTPVESRSLIWWLCSWWNVFATMSLLCRCDVPRIECILMIIFCFDKLIVV